MEFKEAMQIFKKICEGKELCEGCVLEGNCIVLKRCDIERAEETLAKWAAEHPERTIADDFFEKHPKATRDAKGEPDACAGHCGYCDECPSGMSCFECWQRPLAERRNAK